MIERSDFCQTDCRYRMSRSRPALWLAAVVAIACFVAVPAGAARIDPTATGDGIVYNGIDETDLEDDSIDRDGISDDGIDKSGIVNDGVGPGDLDTQDTVDDGIDDEGLTDEGIDKEDLDDAVDRD